MCKKLILLVSVVLVLDLILISGASASDPDLVGWWKLDDGSGDIVTDLSASGNDGTIHNTGGGLGPNGSVWVEDPERGMVLSFNGDNTSGAYVSTDMIIPAMDFENDFTWAFWAKQQGDGTGVNEIIIGNRYAADGSDPLQFIKFTPTKFEYYNDDAAYIDGFTYEVPLPDGVWMHHCVVKDGGTLTYYRDGEEIATVNPTKTIQENPFSMGGDHTGVEMWSGYLSDVRLYTKALSSAEIVGAMKGIFGPWPYAFNPEPVDGALYSDIWAMMSWSPGAFAASHDVYMGDNFNDVNDGAGDTFRGNQTYTYYLAGIPGNAFPDGLIPGTTYYWRIDEVNEAEPNSPWKGEVWSFSIPPKTAYFPNPADGAELVNLNARLSWTAGLGAKLHYVVFGEDFDEVSNAEAGVLNGTTTFNPGPLELAKTYYWRVGESDGSEMYKGDVWSFTTVGAVSGPDPADGAVDVKPSVILTWDAGTVAASHEVYFGTDADAVANATTASPEYKGPKALGEESYDPGKLTLNTTYYWRIEEVNGTNPDSPWAGNVWSFTTGNFFVIDDFEDYNITDNQIWFAWHDGLGAGAQGTPEYLPGNGTGSAVGDETSPSYTEQTIVHGGNQSMPVSYDNNKQDYAYYSEVEHTLTDQRDWTEEGVIELSLWFHGNAANAAEPLYVAVSNSTGAPAIVVHDNENAAQIDTWTEWTVPLQTLAEQGIVLTNVDKIAIGLGTKGNLTVPGGSGKMFFDDIRLNQPSIDE